MKKALLIVETEAGFHNKLVEKTKESFIASGFETTVQQGFSLDSSYDNIHIVRLLDPLRVSSNLIYPTRAPEARISATVLGLSEMWRKHRGYLEMLSKVVELFIFSIHPASLKKFCAEEGWLQTDWVHFLHEPPYEPTEFYRTMSQGEARNVLGGRFREHIVLYFGTYFFSKGPDTLLQVAKCLPDVDFCFVGDRNLGTITINPVDFAAFPNITFVDRFVTDDEASIWFQACDLVALPYRKYYRNDTSGIFNQAMQAKRRVIVPDFSPFSDLIGQFGEKIGCTYAAEDEAALKTAIERCLSEKTEESAVFDAYLDNIPGWREIGELL